MKRNGFSLYEATRSSEPARRRLTRVLTLSLMAGWLLIGPTQAQEDAQQSVQQIPTSETLILFSTRTHSDSGLTLELDSENYERLLTGISVVTITGLPLPSSSPVDLTLRQVPNLASQVRVANANGEQMIHVPGAAYSGHVKNAPDSYAFLAIFPNMVNGYIDLGDESDLFIISSGDPKASQPPSIIKAGGELLDRSRDPWTCDVSSFLSQRRRYSSPGSALPEINLTVRLGDIFVEADHEIRALFNTSIDAASYVLTMFVVISDIYRRDLSAVWNIPNGYLRVWESEPPWGELKKTDHIWRVMNYWMSDENPLRDLPRLSVHALTHPSFGGVGWMPGICDNDRGYALSSIHGYFPYPPEHTHTDNWDILVVAHEGGHNYNAPHTFDMIPPIECVDGSGPDRGTIMSYCGATGVQNTGMRFHARMQDVIREFMPTVDCLDVRSVDPGDYDYNGELDDADLLASQTCANLQFHAGGCIDTFDFNDDGQVTYCDSDLLALAIDPAARITDCNGDRVPDRCQISPSCLVDSSLSANTTEISGGERLQLDMSIENLTEADLTLNFWLEAVGKDGQPVGNNPAGLSTITLSTGQTLNRHYSIRIPQNAPLGGPYRLHLLVGTEYPLVVADNSISFRIEGGLGDQ